MKVVISACVFVALAAVASTAVVPLNEQPQVAPTVGQQEHLREKRSSYGSPAYSQYGAQYVSPCSASAPISLSPAAGYHLNVAPVHHQAYGQQGYGYVPQYRETDEQEMMSFSDMEPHMSEHMPMARYGYGAPVVASHYGGIGGLGGAGVPGIAGIGHLAAPAAGPAYGVFPGVSTGGCNVPLLLSCSPSISAGKIVKSHPQAYYSAAAAAVPNAYRGVDDQIHTEHEHHQDEATHEQLSTAHETSHQ